MAEVLSDFGIYDKKFMFHNNACQQMEKLLLFPLIFSTVPVILTPNQWPVSAIL